MEPYGAICTIWCHMGPSGPIWGLLGPSGLIWGHMSLFTDRTLTDRTLMMNLFACIGWGWDHMVPYGAI